MRTLFISQTGMTEPLGQSQVIPYLEGLAVRGVEITLLSLEPVATSADDVEGVRRRLQATGISWVVLRRSPSHRFATKVLESAHALTRALERAVRRAPDIIHARSYLPAAVADVAASLTPRSKLLFDCRGMLGDEYADTGYWRRDQFRYRLVKAYERRLFRRADGIVVLTEALRRWMKDNTVVQTENVAVIPCCVDTERFCPDEAERSRLREELGVRNRLVVAYSGSLGTYYLEDEMARFVGALKRKAPDLVFLVLTRSNADSLVRKAVEQGLDHSDVIVRSTPPQQMPAYLACADVGMSFIIPSFSKMGSSPTKVAEYLAAGLPVVLNAGVGDQAELAIERDAAVVLSSFDDDALDAAARHAAEISRRSWEERVQSCRRVAIERFDVARVGVPRYEALYRALLA